MLRKTTVALAAALTVGVAFIATNAFAASERNRANPAGSHVSHNTGVHATGQRHRPGGLRGSLLGVDPARHTPDPLATREAL
jgi:hypothetical protein